MNVQRVVGLLKLLEGWRDFPYDDRSPWPRSEVGPEDCTLSGGQWKVKATGGTATIGYGETEAEFVARYWGKRITQAEALAKMAERVDGFSRGVKGCIKANLTDHQWEAVICRSYQTGAGGFCRSETAALLNADNIDGALDRWRTEFAHPDRSEVEITHFLTADGGKPKEEPMEEWMPGVQHIDRGGSTPVQSNGPTVIVLHTTETDNRASYSGTEPHFEIDDDGSILQYISLARTAKALYNLPGGVETNRRRGRIIQWELVNRAGKIAGITDAQLNGLAQSMRWVDTQLPFDKVAPPQGWFGSEAASDDADSRFTFPAWEDFGGICGHQHVPENDHWDPGRFPIDRLLSRLGGPTPSKEDQLFSHSPIACTHLIAAHSGLFLTSTGDTHGSGVIQKKSDGSLNQRWKIVGHEDGTVSYVNRAGGLALDRPDYKTDAGTFLQVANTEYNDAQRWTYDEVAPYLGRLWAPGTNRLLDVHMASREEGAGLQLWYGNNDWRHQQFVFATTV